MDAKRKEVAGRGRLSTLARGLVILLIGSLSAGALFAVGVLLFGVFGDTEAKIMGSTLLLGAFSLTGLCAALRLERRRAAWLGWLGMAASMVAYALAMVGMWGDIDNEAFAQAMGTAILAAATLAFVSLLLLVKPRTQAVRWVLFATLGLTAVVWGMVQYLVITTPVEPDERYLRVMGALAILVALGAIVAPILGRLGTGKEIGGPRHGVDLRKAA
ncbi:MAG TPA: hypothetical protein VGB28_00225 [Actinomycetota bacterium]|jgi:hypothetical protein